MSETNDSVVDTQETSTGEGTSTETTDKGSQDLSELKSLIEAQQNDIASLKRSLKKANKSEDKTDTSKQTNSDSSELTEKVELLSMQVAGIQADDEIKLAKDLQAETGLPMDKLLNSKYFKSELEDLRTANANAEATTGIKGDKSSAGNAKNTAAYWIAKGEHPTREQVPDRKVRAEIRKAFVDKESGSKGRFYNS